MSLETETSDDCNIDYQTFTFIQFKHAKIKKVTANVLLKVCSYF
jgi:hypothetical protein